MMGFVWVGMLVLSVFAALLEGRLGVLTSAAMEGASAAVTLCLSLAGALCLWSGVAKVMERAGLTEKLCEIAHKKHPDRDDTALMTYLEGKQ